MKDNVFYVATFFSLNRGLQCYYWNQKCNSLVFIVDINGSKGLTGEIESIFDGEFTIQSVKMCETANRTENPTLPPINSVEYCVAMLLLDVFSETFIG